MPRGRKKFNFGEEVAAAMTGKGSGKGFGSYPGYIQFLIVLAGFILAAGLAVGAFAGATGGTFELKKVTTAKAAAANATAALLVSQQETEAAKVSAADAAAKIAAADAEINRLNSLTDEEMMEQAIAKVAAARAAAITAAETAVADAGRSVVSSQGAVTAAETAIVTAEADKLTNITALSNASTALTNANNAIITKGVRIPQIDAEITTENGNMWQWEYNIGANPGNYTVYYKQLENIRDTSKKLIADYIEKDKAKSDIITLTASLSSLEQAVAAANLPSAESAAALVEANHQLDLRKAELAVSETVLTDARTALEILLRK